MIEVVVGRALLESRVDDVPAPRDIHQVEDHEEADDDAAPAHRAGGVVGRDVVAAALVTGRPRGAVQRVRL